MKRFYTLFLLASIGFTASAQNFTQGNLVVFRSGDGTAALSSVATAAFLDEYTPTGTFVRTIALPTTVNGLNRRLTTSGSATGDGLITRSADKQYIIVGGYDAALATASVATTAPGTVNRVIGRVDYTGNVDATTALTDHAGNIRGTTSSNGTDLWAASSSGGLRYTTLGSTGTTTQVTSTITNLRGVNIFGGQLYISTGSGSTTRIGAVGTGMPTTTGQTIVSLPGVPTSTLTNPWSFHFADLDAGVPGPDVLYVADEASGISKFSLVGGVWTANGSITQTSRGLTGTNQGTVVTLYGTTIQSNANSIFALVDPSGYNGTITGVPVTLASTITNTAFRGIALAPEQLSVVAVQLTNFAAQKISNSVKLSWSTEQELNSRNFIIERSSNGRNWTEINTLAAAGNSNRKIDYFISDYSPQQGINYYRVKLVDVTGQSQYSVVRLVSMTKDASMIISPNPARDFINVNYLKNNNGPIVVTLADANGKTILQTKTTESIIRLDLRNVNKGTYIVFITDGDKVSSEKVLVQ